MLRISRKIVQFQLRCFCQQQVPLSSSLSSRLFEYLGRDERPKENLRKFNFNGSCSEEIQSSLRRELKATASDSSKIFQLIDRMFQENTNVQLPRLKFFGDALLILFTNLKTKFDKNDFIKLCFYATFYKKNDPGPEFLRMLFEEFLAKAMDEKLTRLDVTILCLASYKTSVRIQNDKFHQKVIDEFVTTNEEDEYIFVALLKSLRFNRIKNDKILNKLRLLDCSKHDYQSLIHILPYIADNGIIDSELSNKIVRRSIETFNSTSRVKDIQKMIHSCALLNLKIERTHFEALEKLIVNATRSDEYQKFFDHFVNSALSLWILDYKCLSLARILLKDRRFYVSGPYSRVKLDSRMKLLSTCIEIESPELLKTVKYKSFDETRPSPGFLIKPSLEKVMTKRFKSHKNAVFVHQVKNLNIAGILVTNDDGSKTHYEVLDEVTSLADRVTPDGLFELKLRLLKRMSCNVKVINALNS